MIWTFGYQVLMQQGLGLYLKPLSNGYWHLRQAQFYFLKFYSCETINNNELFLNIFNCFTFCFQAFMIHEQLKRLQTPEGTFRMKVKKD